MKKLFLAFAVVTMFICAACGGHKAESTTSVEDSTADSVTVVDSLVIDTTLIDSVN